jgi:hypothetical protein
MPFTPEQQAAIDAATKRLSAPASTVSPQDRLLPEVQGLGPNATDAQIQAVKSARERMIADQQSREGIIPQGKEFVRSLGEGVAQIPGAITAPFSAAANLLRGGVDYMRGAPVTVVPNPTPVQDLYNWEFPPNPNFPETRKWGNVAGPAIVEAIAPELMRPMMGGGPADLSLKQTVARPAMTTASTVLGGKAGESIGQTVGGDFGGQVGQGLGSIFGSVAVPPIAATAERALNPILTDEGTPGRVRAFDQAGVPITAGGVGSKQAGFVEDSIAGVPLVGGPVYAARRAQRGAMDMAAGKAGNEIRGGPYVGQGISEASIGGQAQDAAQTAISVTKHKGDAILNPIYDPIRDVPLDQQPELTQLGDLRRGVQPFQRAPVDRAIGTVNDTRLDPLNPPKVVDPAVEAMLQTRLQNIQSSLAALPPTSPIRPTLEANLRWTADQIQRNRGSTGQEVIEQRSDLARPIENAPPLVGQTLLNAKNIKTDTLRQGVIKHGTATGEEFDAANAKYGALKEQRDLLSPVASNPDQGAAYTKVFGSGGEDNLSLQRALDENTPSPQLGQMLADNLELKMRGRAAGDPTANPESVDPGAALKWWTGLPPQTRDLYAPPGSTARAKLDALTEVYAADLRRPTRTLPGKGGNTMGGPLALLSVMGGLGGVLGGNGVGGAAGSLLPLAGTYAIGKTLVNPTFTRAVANPGPFLPASELSRLLVGAVGAQRR